MPLYNYVCNDCGPFEEWQSMSQSAEPNTCTNCGEQSGRDVSTPALALMSPITRTAHFRNEKSASNPEVVNKPKNVKAEEGHGKSKGHTHHNHAHSHGHGPSRPWMIGH
ncbi:MAG: zinc ribbon domain-containing protein [Rhodospirillales bacterium]|jgi:putative FmdB family regulatory protein|nr:zinc ribbon domain-containing protein [Rhodospirillales bacterium]